MDNFFDTTTRKLAEYLLGDSFGEAEPRLQRLGSLAAGPVDQWAAICDRQPPELVSHDRNGERIDEVAHHPAYRAMEAVAYGEGCVAASYDEGFKSEHGGRRHSYGLLLGYLFSQGEAGLYCPVCMTDGMARLLELHGSQALRDRFIPRLASTNASNHLTGGMFLTEKQGGSDVGLNTTQAVPDGEGWRLTGDKWFCSNVDADLVAVLARPDGSPAGTKGLGLYVMPKIGLDGQRNHYRINRLKDKLGTRSMATGEVTLEGAFAWELGGPGQGFRMMTDMINLSRLYNAVTAAAVMRRAYNEAKSWCAERVTFGRRLQDHPLVVHQLAELDRESLGATAMAFQVAVLMDKVDAGEATPDEQRLWRILTPMTKYFTAKQAVALTSECLELVGGNGYVEDWPMARFLRDAQVLPIWEGATNICVLDVGRTIRKESAHLALADALDAWGEDGQPFREAPDSDVALRQWSDAAARVVQRAAIRMVWGEGHLSQPSSESAKMLV